MIYRCQDGGAVQTFALPVDTGSPGTVKNVLQVRLGEGGVEGSGTLLGLEFRVLDIEANILAIQGAILADSNAESIPAQVDGVTLNTTAVEDWRAY